MLWNLQKWDILTTISSELFLFPPWLSTLPKTPSYFPSCLLVLGPWVSLESRQEKLKFGHHLVWDGTSILLLAVLVKEWLRGLSHHPLQCQLPQGHDREKVIQWCERVLESLAPEVCRWHKVYRCKTNLTALVGKKLSSDFPQFDNNPKIWTVMRCDAERNCSKLTIIKKDKFQSNMLTGRHNYFLCLSIEKDTTK